MLRRITSQPPPHSIGTQITQTGCLTSIRNCLAAIPTLRRVFEPTRVAVIQKPSKVTVAQNALKNLAHFITTHKKMVIGIATIGGITAHAKHLNGIELLKRYIAKPKASSLPNRLSSTTIYAAILGLGLLGIYRFLNRKPSTPTAPIEQIPVPQQMPTAPITVRIGALAELMKKMPDHRIGCILRSGVDKHQPLFRFNLPRKLSPEGIAHLIRLLKQSKKQEDLISDLWEENQQFVRDLLNSELGITASEQVSVSDFITLFNTLDKTESNDVWTAMSKDEKKAVWTAMSFYEHFSAYCSNLSEDHWPDIWDNLMSAQDKRFFRSPKERLQA